MVLEGLGLGSLVLLFSMASAQTFRNDIIIMCKSRQWEAGRFLKIERREKENKIPMKRKEEAVIFMSY